jgi:hypothetical protein
MKAYQIMGIDTAIHLLRPGAKWEWTGGLGFTRWDDPRPKPSVEEVMETIEKIKTFEESIDTILLPEQQQAFDDHVKQIEAEMNA